MAASQHRQSQGSDVPESKGRKKTPYVPPPTKKESARYGPSRWVAPVMVGCFLIGLLWIVAFYIAGDSIPIMKNLGNLWNVLIGFGFIGAGFITATRGR